MSLHEPYQARNPQYAERIHRKLEHQYFMHHLGLELSTIQPGYIEASVALQQHHQQQDGMVHGGLTATLADISTGFAAFSLAAAQQRVVTAELSVSYLKPGKGDRLLAVGWVTKPGTRLFFCEGHIYCFQESEKTMIARAHAIMAAFIPSENALAENGQRH